MYTVAFEGSSIQGIYMNASVELLKTSNVERLKICLGGVVARPIRDAARDPEIAEPDKYLGPSGNRAVGYFEAFSRSVGLKTPRSLISPHCVSSPVMIFRSFRIHSLSDDPYLSYFVPTAAKIH